MDIKVNQKELSKLSIADLMAVAKLCTADLGKYQQELSATHVELNKRLKLIFP